MPNDTESALFAGDAIEVLCEQIEYLKLELRYKDQKIQELEQELKETNQELCNALNSERSSFDEAQELAKVLLEKNLPVKDALDLMLTSIYGSVVKPGQLLPLPNSAIERSQSKLINPDKLEKETQTLMVNSGEVVSRLILLRKHLAELKDRCKQIKVRTHRQQQMCRDRDTHLPNVN